MPNGTFYAPVYSVAILDICTKKKKRKLDKEHSMSKRILLGLLITALLMFLGLPGFA